MSRKGSIVKSDYMPWNDMLAVVRKLYKDGNHRVSLLIGCGCFFGLRISDLRMLRWEQLFAEQERFTITERKTGKMRTIKVNADFKQHIKLCYEALGQPSLEQFCFLSRKKVPFTTQRVNVILKEVKQRYNLKVEHISSHTMRKTFGRRIVEQAGDNAEMALIKLSEIFSHSSPQITRIYLGLRKEELESCYDMLEFI